MGYNHYLRRDDNRTLFDLGKHVGDWMEALGGGAPIVLGPEDEPALASALAADIATWGGTFGPSFESADGYARHVAKAIVTWCDGNPFRFVGEDGFDNWVCDDSWDRTRAITGTRYSKPPKTAT